MRTCYKAALTAAAFFVGMNAAMAASPVGQWNVTFYREPSLAKGATQGICYKSDGTWYSSTFSNWHGDWFQKGDRFRWYGETSSTWHGRVRPVRVRQACDRRARPLRPRHRRLRECRELGRVEGGHQVPAAGPRRCRRPRRPRSGQALSDRSLSVPGPRARPRP